MILIFETHPIQYKAPIYQRLQQLRPDSFKVVYGTDGSMRDAYDAEFGRKVTWDAPLLDGYPNIVLNNQKGTTLQGFRSLTGRGVFKLLGDTKPEAILVAPFLFQFDATVFCYARLLRIPIWIRVETQDEAFVRPKWKGDVRTAFYWLMYKAVSHAFCIGSLNREHLLRHGIKEEKITFSPYASPLTYPATNEEKQHVRDATRAKLGYQPDDIVLMFSGKLIDKKNPLLILTALGLLPADIAKRIKVLYVGSGELEPALRREAEKFPGQVQFAGFVNQSEMAAHYLAADVLILPSRRMGETWGLVVNEALGAGCGVVMTNAVGCFQDFNNSERIRVIPDNSSNACAQAIIGLAKMPRSFDWSAQYNALYSIENAAQALAKQIDIAKAQRAAAA